VSIVHFIGAGPGDAELITVKGARLLREAHVVVYAGSLVDRELVRTYAPDAEVYDSAAMTLEETTAVLAQAVADGKRAARLHTGDPSIYGAIQEQMRSWMHSALPTTWCGGNERLCRRRVLKQD